MQMSCLKCKPIAKNPSSCALSLLSGSRFIIRRVLRLPPQLPFRFEPCSILSLHTLLLHLSLTTHSPVSRLVFRWLPGEIHRTHFPSLSLLVCGLLFALMKTRQWSSSGLARSSQSSAPVSLCIGGTSGVMAGTTITPPSPSPTIVFLHVALNSTLPKGSAHRLYAKYILTTSSLNQLLWSSTPLLCTALQPDGCTSHRTCPKRSHCLISLNTRF